jgi:hypothetical protein
MDRGFDVYGMAYPHDDTSASVKQLVAACGYESARTGGQLLCDTYHACAESVPPADPYALRTPLDFQAATTLAQMKAAVTNAENAGGGWVPLELHEVCDGDSDPLLPAGAHCPSPYVVTRARFAQFLDWLQSEVAAGRVQVKTVHQVIGGSLKPEVDVDPAPLRTGNLLVNPSFETAGASGQPSDCWSNVTNGPDTPPAFASTSDAHAGSKALAISVPAGYESWATNAVVPVLDLAQCAPRAVPGDRYAFSGWYKGGAPIKVAVWWRNGDNRWMRLDGAGATFAAAGAWTKASLSFQAPAGATAVSAGFAIDGSTSAHPGGTSYVVDDTSRVDLGPPPRLTVGVAGRGAGTVTSAPGGIACPGTCEADVDPGTAVTLTAASGPDSSFAGWSGACAGEAATCVVTMSAARTVTATFERLPLPLVVALTGTGAGAVRSDPAGVDCGATCQVSVAYGTTVVLTASALPGSSFAGWSGACSGSAPACAVDMSAARTVGAVFTAILPPPAVGIVDVPAAPGAPAAAGGPSAPPAPAAATVSRVARPRSLARPSLRGRARAGSTLVCSRGRWSGAGVRTRFAWRRGGRVVRRARTYRVRAADRGRLLRCEVTARNAAGSRSAMSRAVRVAR